MASFNGYFQGEGWFWALLAGATAVGAFFHPFVDWLIRLWGWKTERDDKDLIARIKKVADDEMSVLRQHVDAVHKGHEGALAVIQDRIAANHQDHLEFKAEVYRYLATKKDLSAAEARIIKAIDLAVGR